MNSYYVYIIECSDNSYYTGITNNIHKRFIEHNNGKHKDCYTFKRIPLKLKFQEIFSDVLQAIYFEKKIKGWTRAKKETLIKGEFDRLQYLSECRNATHHKYYNKNNTNR
ncbi:GIY-YIG nuclease family protein [Psychroserpens sp.]